MGFWDFIAPDFDGFREALEPYVPDEVGWGKLTIPKDLLIDLAYVAPASAAGIAARVIYQNSNVQGNNQSAAQSLCNALLEQLARGGQNALATTSAGGDLTVGATMAPVVIANCYAATVKAVFGGQPILNTFHVQGTGPGQETAAATALQTAWKITGGPLGQFDNKYTLVEFEAVDLSSTSGGIAVIADTTAGTRAAQSTAGRQTAALITYNGTTRSRSQRGRTYLGPLYEPDIDVDGASLAAGVVTGLTARWTAFRTSLTGSNFPLVIASRKLMQSYAVTSFRVEPVIATQRRRLR